MLPIEFESVREKPAVSFDQITRVIIRGGEGRQSGERVFFLEAEVDLVANLN